MVLLHVTSNDNTCMTLSIQNSSVCINKKIYQTFYSIITTSLFFQCPVFDSLETVQYHGLRQTVSKTGGIIVSVCI